jgi:hypothetical protein
VAGKALKSFTLHTLSKSINPNRIEHYFCTNIYTFERTTSQTSWENKWISHNTRGTPAAFFHTPLPGACCDQWAGRCYHLGTTFTSTRDKSMHRQTSVAEGLLSYIISSHTVTYFNSVGGFVFPHWHQMAVPVQGPKMTFDPHLPHNGKRKAQISFNVHNTNPQFGPFIIFLFRLLVKLSSCMQGHQDVWFPPPPLKNT